MFYMQDLNGEITLLPNNASYMLTQKELDLLNEKLTKTTLQKIHPGLECSFGKIILVHKLMEPFDQDYEQCFNIIDKNTHAKQKVYVKKVNCTCVRCAWFNPKSRKCICKNECKICYTEERCTCTDRAARRADELSKTFFIDCRSVGPGGTTIMFKAFEDGVKAIWTNENCPYISKDTTSCLCDSEDINPRDNEIDFCPSHKPLTKDEDDAASDEHNVSFVDYVELDKLLTYAKSKGWYKP